MKKMLFVMNPYAGIRRANRYLTDIISIFNRAGYDVLTYMTTGPGDGARIVEEKAADMDLVVCCGGDGTFNEAITGLLRGGYNVPVGYIPAGSTNDFAASLKLPTNVLQAARAIVEGTVHQYDVGQFAGRYFSYVASFGAFTKASYSTPQNVKNALGHMAYLLEGTKELSQLKAEHVRIELDDGTVIEDEFLFGAISNSTSLAGIVTLDPKRVDMSDGKFELLLVRAPRSMAEISECIMALYEQKYDCSMIRFLPASRVKVIADPSMAWTLDGEKEEGHAQVEISNLHHAISLIKKG